MIRPATPADAPAIAALGEAFHAEAGWGDIARVTDAGFASELAGMDLTEFMAEPLHVVLSNGRSGAMFAFRGPGIYEVHVFFRDRGRRAIALGHAMLDLMRAEYGGRLFWALVPVESRHVIMFTRLMGWKSCGVVQTRNGPNELFMENGGCLQQ